VHKSTRTRYAALPFRRSRGRWEVLLVTTRRSGRWIVPKGRAKDGCTPARTAKLEALEEAGVVGAVGRKAIGSFEMKSRFAGPRVKANRISVYPLAVRRQHERWKEDGERHRRWMTIAQAVRTVHPEGLGDLLRAFRRMLRDRTA
jgi:8-oxo-dGTP pyrophosphatase MutT (NUDIX family)